MVNREVLERDELLASSVPEAAPTANRPGEMSRVEFSEISLPASLLQEFLQAKRRRTLLALGAFVADGAAIVTSLLLANFGYLGEISLNQGGSMIAVCLPTYLIFAFNNRAYRPNAVSRYWYGIAKALAALSFAAATMLMIAFVLKVGGEFSRGVFLLGIALAAISIPVWRALLLRTLLNDRNARLNVNLLINDGLAEHPSGTAFVINAADYRIEPDLGCPEAVARIGELVKYVDRLTVACPPDRRAAWADVFRILDVPSEVIVKEFDRLTPIALTRRDGHIALTLSNGGLRWDQRLAKRVFDLAITVPATVLLAPLLILIAVGIRIDSPGPIFFRQERIGLGNRPFKIWKFRSMRHEMQDLAAAQLTQRNDVRVTKFGNFLRKTSLDELPQLFNVIAGDMSLVGPRPHTTSAKAGDALYWEVDRGYWERHVVKPGITGLAQVTGFRGNTFHADDLRGRLEADLFYVMNWSLLGDLLLLLRTFSVLTHKNAF